MNRRFNSQIDRTFFISQPGLIRNGPKISIASLCMSNKSRDFREILLVCAGAVVISLLFTWRIFNHIENWGISDWDQHLAYHEAARRSILNHGEIPLWNPYNSGGFPDLANVQSRVLSPTFLLVLLFGTAPGLKLEITVHCALALIFGYFLGRKLGMARAAAIVSSTVFALSGLYTWPLTFGMSWNLSIAYVPLLVYGFLSARETLQKAWIGGAAIALIFFGGGIYVITLISMMLCLWVLLDTVRERNLRSVQALAACGIWGACLGAVKLIPSIQLMLAHPRNIQDISGYSVVGLLYSLFVREQSVENFTFAGESWFWNGVSYDFDENYMYVGVFSGLLVACAVLTRWRKVNTQLLLMLACLGFMAGNALPYSLWTVLHGLPILNSMRVAQRFRIPFMLSFAIVSGWGMDWIWQRWRWIAVLLTVLLTVDLVWVNGRVLQYAFPFPPVRVLSQGEFRHVHSGTPYDESGLITATRPSRALRPVFAGVMPGLLRNEGTLSAWESALIRDSAGVVASDVLAANDALYRGEVCFAENPGAEKNHAAITAWTPNRVKIHYSAVAAGTLLLNQNFDPGWKATNGDRVFRYTPPRPAGAGESESLGLVAVAARAGEGDMELYYSPDTFWFGLAISGATILVFAIFVLRPTLFPKHLRHGI